MGAQPLGFALPQPSGVYPQQVYVPPGTGLWSRSGSALSDALSTASSRRELHVAHLAIPKHSINMVGHIALGTWQTVTQSFFLPTWQQRPISLRF